MKEVLKNRNCIPPENNSFIYLNRYCRWCKQRGRTV